MDWISVGNVAVGALAAIAAQIVPAFTKRGDRKHQTALEYEKRVGDDKRRALLAVIHWAKGIQKETAPRTDSLVAYYPRADVLLYAATNPMELGDEVIAYTGTEVQKKYDDLARRLDKALIIPVRLLLGLIRDHDAIYEAEIAKRAEHVEQGDPADANALTAFMMNAGESASKAMGYRDSVEKNAKIDPDELYRLAGELIAAAQKDMRG